MGKRIHPYRVITSNDDRYSSQAKIRWDHTLRFLQDAPPGNRVLEIGERTSLTDMIEKAWNCTITNTNGDLDVLNLEGLYDVVLSFEVLEHLFNPLFHLLQIHQVLTDGGRLFLSTPKGKPYFLWSPEHFHEMGTERLKDLLTRIGEDRESFLQCLQKTLDAPLDSKKLKAFAQTYDWDQLSRSFRIMLEETIKN
ncbi:class I SAM-dependent methyltransferase [Candidatus Neomarinimicrobiota bacterium]